MWSKTQPNLYIKPFLAVHVISSPLYNLDEAASWQKKEGEEKRQKWRLVKALTTLFNLKGRQETDSKLMDKKQKCK